MTEQDLSALEATGFSVICHGALWIVGIQRDVKIRPPETPEFNTTLPERMWSFIELPRACPVAVVEMEVLATGSDLATALEGAMLNYQRKVTT